MWNEVGDEIENKVGNEVSDNARTLLPPHKNVR